MCFDFLYRFVFKISHLKKNSARYFIINIEGSSCKYPLFLSGLNETLFLSTVFRKTKKYEISSGRPGFPCGQRDIAKVIVDFRNFVNAAKSVHSAHTVFSSCFISEQRANLLYII